MEIRILAQGKNDPAQLGMLPEPFINLTMNETMTFCVVENGMSSGDPSVLILSIDKDGTVCLQTSLDKFLAAASGMLSIAQNKWGWKQQEGYITIIPPDKKTQKELLESLKKELEGWDDVL